MIINWLQPASRMNKIRCPLQMISYKPTGFREPGRAMKIHLDEADTGLLIPLRIHDDYE